jgi:hypothetical protein
MRSLLAFLDKTIIAYVILSKIRLWEKEKT